MKAFAGKPKQLFIEFASIRLLFPKAWGDLGALPYQTHGPTATALRGRDLGGNGHPGGLSQADAEAHHETPGQQQLDGA